MAAKIQKNIFGTRIQPTLERQTKNRGDFSFRKLREYDGGF